MKRNGNHYVEESSRKRRKGNRKVQKSKRKKKETGSKQVKFHSRYKTAIMKLLSQGENKIEKTVLDLVMKNYNNPEVEKRDLLNKEKDFVKAIVKEVNTFIEIHNAAIEDYDESVEDEDEDEERTNSLFPLQTQKYKRLFLSSYSSTIIEESPKVFSMFIRKNRGALIESLKSINVFDGEELTSIVDYSRKEHNSLLETRNAIEKKIENQPRPNHIALEYLNKIMKNPKMNSVTESEEFQKLLKCLNGKGENESFETVNGEAVTQLNMDLSHSDPYYPFSFEFSAICDMKPEELSDVSMKDLHQIIINGITNNPSRELLSEKRKNLMSSHGSISDKEKEINNTFNNYETQTDAFYWLVIFLRLDLTSDEEENEKISKEPVVLKISSSEESDEESIRRINGRIRRIGMK